MIPVRMADLLRPRPEARALLRQFTNLTKTMRHVAWYDERVGHDLSTGGVSGGGGDLRKAKQSGLGP
jgi:hypothetical protein